MHIHTRSSGRARAVGFLTIAAAAATSWLATSPVAALVPLTIEAGPDVAVLEGSPLVRSVAIVDEIDDGEAGWSYSIDYGDGLITTGTTVQPVVTLDHAYPDGPATHTATVTVSDVPGDVAGDSFVVTVQNVAPAVTTVAAATSPEGATWTLTVAATDPAASNDPLSMSLDWGDGFTTQSFRPLGTVTHVFRDDVDGTVNATVRTVRVTVFDGNAISSVSVPVTVTDVAPTIAVSGAATATPGVPYQLTLGAITDPGLDTVSSRIIRWGDGTSDTVAAAGTFAHTYTSGGARTIAIDLVNEDGTHTSAGTLAVAVAPVAPTAPTGLTANAISKSSIDLSWSNTSTDQTSITVQRCKGATCTNFATIATLPGTATSYRNSGLGSRTTYRYRVRATNSVGSSAFSTVASATTLR